MLFMLGMVSGISVVGVVVLVCILMDMMKKLRTIENKLTETKAQLRYVKDHSDYRAYAEMRDSNEIANEVIDELSKWNINWQDAYKELNKRYDDLEERYNEAEEIADTNLLDYSNYVSEFIRSIDEDLIIEFDLYIMNSYRAEDGLPPMTMEEFLEMETEE